ncbi:Mediator of RNA polymerase II transcription subunit 23 [Quillaja saponaria]|uniref:Mediator of RNA polymerase II transcription subunit 23 n=1 Tax=Quillaja saponaria TaxID=32244 RepID=A0AAD7VI33_QUISA|nr:Mediator of RNA polymerase II transcription subunit 23 [Quillaja saponaria]
MERESDIMLHDKNDSRPMNELTGSRHLENDDKNVSKKFIGSAGDNVPPSLADRKGENYVARGLVGEVDGPGDVNMEASITSDDIIRAGGFGARDDISSFLPVASDSTDFEALIRDARDYEEPQGEVCRPGLGWRDTRKTE